MDLNPNNWTFDTTGSADAVVCTARANFPANAPTYTLIGCASGVDWFVTPDGRIHDAGILCELADQSPRNARYAALIRMMGTWMFEHGE